MQTLDEYCGLLAVVAERLDEVAGALMRTMPLQFSAHNSGYWGPYLLHGDEDAGHIRIYFNRDPLWREGEPVDERFFEADFPGHRVLVDVSLPSDTARVLLQDLSAVFPDTVVVSEEGA